MRYTRIPPDTAVLERGRRIELPGGPTAVLVVHGWTGWPSRLAYLAERLHACGHTVAVPRLPGHGTNTRDLLQTRADDWVRRAVDEYLDLAARHEKIFVVGTSMGAVIAAMVAARFNVERVALLAPAFRVRNRLLGLSPLVKGILPRLRGDWSEDQEADPGNVEIAREYSTYNYTRTAAELVRVQRAGRRALRDLTVPTMVIVSLADRSVPPEVADLIRTRSRSRDFEKVVVSRSNHHLAEHVDREQVADAVVRWFDPR